MRLPERPQALRPQVLFGLHFDGEHAVAPLHEEVYLARGVLRRPVVGDEPAVGHELLADVLLCEGPLELLEDPVSPDDRLFVQLRHRSEQPDVDQEEFERCVVSVGGQGDAGFGNPADDRRDARLGEPCDAGAVVPRAGPLRDVAEHELLIFPAQMRRYRPPCSERVFGLGSAEVFRDVALVALQYLELDLARVLEKAPFEEGAHRLGHASHVVVLAEEGDELAGEAVYQVGVSRVDQFAEPPVPRRREELPEMERVEVERVHLAHGVSAALVDRDAQKRPRRGDRVPRSVLAKILKGGERLRARLYLVQDDEGAAFRDDLAGLELYGGDDTRDVVAGLELLAHAWVVVQVHVRDVVEAPSPELLEQPRLADLARPVEDERLSAGAVLPGDELVHEEPVHASLLVNRLRPYFRTKWRKQGRKKARIGENQAEFYSHSIVAGGLDVMS